MASISFNRKLRTRSKRVRVCTFVVYFSNGCCIIFTSSTNSIRALTWTHSNYKRYGALSVHVCVCVHILNFNMRMHAVVVRCCHLLLISFYLLLTHTSVVRLYFDSQVLAFYMNIKQSQVGYCNHIHGINSGSKMAIAFVHGSKSTCKSIQ